MGVLQSGVAQYMHGRPGPIVSVGPFFPNELLDDEMLPVCFLQTINRADIGMIEGGRGFGFLSEAVALYTIPMPPSPSLSVIL